MSLDAATPSAPVATRDVQPQGGTRPLMSLPARRQLGAYYTSEALARVLVGWAVRDASDTVMDPSYGGCAFLRQALERLSEVGATDPMDRVYGADIDSSTALWRAHLISQGVPAGNLHQGDFLLARPGQELPRCSAVVGNPPYVRHHLLSETQLSSYGGLRQASGLSGRASAWAYFVVHVLSFVAPGGRLALLLPGATLHGDGYATRVREILREKCERVVMIRVRERLFSDAAEETVVLLAVLPGSSTHAGPAVIEQVDVADTDELALRMANWPEAHRLPSPSLMPANVAAIVDRAREQLPRLAELADVRIGVVTGANAFFVRSMANWPTDEAAQWRPVVSRGAWLDRLRWTDDDTARHEREGGRTRLLLVDGLRWSPDDGGPLADEVKAAEKEGLNQRSHTRKRAAWFDVGAVPVPDVFLPYMGRCAGRPVLNDSRATSTNAVHHVTWRDAPVPDRALARVLSGWSTLWQVVGEIEGRHYGGGVLKLEPSVAGRMPLWDRDTVDRWISRVLARARSATTRETLTQAADALMERALGLTEADTAARAATAERLRGRRPRRGG